jgi:glutaminyl-peptide cyclotransferase
MPRVALLLPLLAATACRPVRDPGCQNCDDGETGRNRGVRPAMSLHILRSVERSPVFTQGLLVDGGWLYESAGGYGHSLVRRIAFSGGQLGELTARDVDPSYFAEGLTLVPGAPPRLFQLTWRENTALVRDAQTLEVVSSHRYDGEGWGLCYDASRQLLVRSDGQTTKLWLHRVSDFAPAGEVEVGVSNLNELECVDGHVYANVWHSDEILKIAPDGAVVARIDARSLATEVERRGGRRGAEEVLNGIAHDAATGHFWLTGKMWPLLFEVTFTAADERVP